METLYPGADKSLYFGDRAGLTGPMPSPEKIVLHSTEGPQVYTYRDGKDAPHFTVDDGRGVIYQHLPLDRNARALVNKPGGIETNTDGAVQIEIIGSCDPKSGVKPFLPGLKVEDFGPLVALLTWISAQAGIPLAATPRGFQAYPASYGARGRTNSVRMTYQEWDSFRGVCGHQHVPENDHGDPGNIPVDGILAAARGAAAIAAPKAGSLAASITTAKRATGIAVDGILGRATVTALQRRVGAPADGIMGPQTIKALQRHLGVGADGILGRATVTALQRKVGATPDGKMGPQTIAALQRWLNR